MALREEEVVPELPAPKTKEHHAYENKEQSQNRIRKRPRGPKVNSSKGKAIRKFYDMPYPTNRIRAIPKENNKGYKMVILDGSCSLRGG